VADPIFDGTINFSAGQDASKEPGQIAANAYASGINITAQKGVLGPRWGWRYRKLTFPAGTVVIPGGKTRTYEDLFYSGKWQAVAPYSIGQDFYLIIIVSGIIYLVNQTSFSVTVLELPLTAIKLSPNVPRYNTSPAGKFFIIYDYPAYPVIIEDSIARRADPDKDEVLISTIGTYNQNRLFVVNNGNEFTAGDPVGSTLTPNAPITFTEVLFPSSPYVNQIFQLSTNYNNDPITAITALPMIDTSTGIGPLIVSTANAIYSYLTQNPRSQWETQQFASNIVFNMGIAGPAAQVIVGSDLYYLGVDGQLRSLSMSRDEQKRWSKIPISKEVENWLKFKDKRLVQYGAITYFKNKIIVACNPYVSDAVSLDGNPTVDYVHAGMAVLELDNISTLGQAGTPAWAGLWTGIRPMGFSTNNNRCFAIAKEGGSNLLYELDPELTYDIVPEGIRYINSTVYTKEYDFQDQFQNKTLNSLDVSVMKVQGDFELKASYLPSHGENFVEWGTFKHKSPWRTCNAPQTKELQGFVPHSFKEVNFGSPAEDVCSDVSEDLYAQVREVQVKLEITGKDWTVKGLKLTATPKRTVPRITICDETETVAAYAECSIDWKIPEINLCRQTKT